MILKFNVGENSVEMTVEEARKLYKELSLVFNTMDTPMTTPFYQPPFVNPQPRVYGPGTIPPGVWCHSTPVAGDTNNG